MILIELKYLTSTILGFTPPIIDLRLRLRSSRLLTFISHQQLNHLLM